MLPVLYQDDRLIAIHKPSGLLMHRSALDRHETRFAVQLLRDQIGRRVFPAHRLDRGTSGVLLFALDREAAALLGNAFEKRAVRKRYLAVVRGYPTEAGLIDHALSRRQDDAQYRHTEAAIEPQAARTRFWRLAQAELNHRVDRYPTSRYALLALEPETGRRHQLRRHLKHVSHPIIGDATFGKGRHNRLFATLFGVDRLLLACTNMRFTHPCSAAVIDLCCPPAPDFMEVVAGLGWALKLTDCLAPATDGLSIGADS